MSSAPIPAQQLQPKPQRKSRQDQAIQTAALAKYMLGESKSKIASDLELDRATVSAILSASEIQQHIDYGRSRAVQLIPRSLDVMDTRLAKGSESAAIAILRGTQVFQSQASQQVTNNSFAINLLQLKQARHQDALPAQIAPITAPIEQVSTPKRKPGRPKKVVDNAKS